MSAATVASAVVIRVAGGLGCLDVGMDVGCALQNLRHQCEYELRSKIIQLRRLYIPAARSVEKLCDLMSDSLASFAARPGFD